MESISWKDHPSDLISFLAKVYQNGELIDCVLDTEGGLLKGHRVILGACSPYLKKLLTDHEGTRRMIVLKQAKYQDMKHILDFIYYGEASVPAADVASVMKTCELLQIVSLRSCLVPYVSGKSPCNRGTNRDVVNRRNQGSGRSCVGKLYLNRKDESVASLCKKVQSHGECSGSEEGGSGSSFQLNDVESRPCERDVDPENSGDETSNVARAAIPLVAVKIEGLDDQEDDEVEDVVEGGTAKGGDDEVVFPTGSGIKLEKESESDVCENNTPERKIGSFGRETRLTGGNALTATERRVSFDDSADSNNSECSIVEQTGDLEKKFESVCEVSEFGVEAEKPLVSCVNSKNIEEHDTASSLLKQQQQQRAESSADVKVVRDGLCVGDSSSNSAEEPKESTVSSLLRRKPPHHHETNIAEVHSEFDDKKETVKNNTSEDDQGFKLKCEHDLSAHGDEDVLLCPSPSGSEHDLPEHGKRTELAAARRSCNAHKPAVGKRSAVSKYHSEEKSYDCDICGKSFKIKSRLTPHMRIHTGEKPFDCGICGKSFDAKSRLKPHMRIHTGEKPYVCEICGKSFNQNGGLKVHMRTHTGEKPFPCGDCDAAFIQKYLLEKHTHKFHTKERLYLCNVCGKSFFTSCSLKRHMMTHSEGYPHTKECSDAKVYQFLCHVCEKPFVHKSQLNAHMVIHTGERPYQCSICKKTFRQRCSLYTHKKIHTGEKNHHCTYCAKSFIHGEDLKRHIRTHTGEKPYPCSICTKAFKAKNKLKVHMRTHTGEKPFLCSICGKALKAKWNLRLHMRTHSGENL